MSERFYKMEDEQVRTERKATEIKALWDEYKDTTPIPHSVKGFVEWLVVNRIVDRVPPGVEDLTPFLR